MILAHAMDFKVFDLAQNIEAVFVQSIGISTKCEIAYHSDQFM